MSEDHRKLRVLVLAEAANPEWVSVPLVGWSLSRAISDVADVHIVTQVRNREAFIRAGLIEGQDFTSIDNEALARPLWNLGTFFRMGEGKGWTALTASSALSYPSFERKVWKVFGNAITNGDYDIVHRITPLSPTSVSHIASKCEKAGVPFVLGPLNGGVPWPKGFGADRRREREWLSYFRAAYKVMPGRQRMLRSCRAIIVGSHYTGSELPKFCSDKLFWVPENAIDPLRFNKISEQNISGALKACSVGRLVPYKGADIAIRAAAPFLKTGKLTLDIIGDGPMRPELEKLVSALGLKESVTFYGHLEHQAVQDVVSKSNLLIFPSIREFGGGAILEAMALGVVPVVVDYAGPGELVGLQRGYKIPVASRGEITSTLHQTLSEILEDPSDLPAMSARAVSYVNDNFTWAAKAKFILEIYNWVLKRSVEKPWFDGQAIAEQATDQMLLSEPLPRISSSM